MCKWNEVSNVITNSKVKLIISKYIESACDKCIDDYNLRNRIVIHDRLMHNKQILILRLNTRLPYSRINNIINPSTINFREVHDRIGRLFIDRKNRNVSRSSIIINKGGQIEMCIRKKILNEKLKEVSLNKK